MNTALVSGANGFIGKSMTKKLLNEGLDVYAIVTDASAMDDIKSNHLHVFQLFFPDYGKIHSLISTKIDLAFHFAWSGLNGPELKNYHQQLDDISYSMMFFEECQKLGVKKFFFASSMNTLETRSYIRHAETFEKPRFTLVHSGSKMLTEIFLKVFGANAGVSVNVGLIAMAFGPGNRSKMVTNVVLSKLQNGISPALVAGNNRYDLIFIDDIVDAFWAMAVSGVANKTYYIGHSEITTFKELFTRIGAIVNPNVKLLFGEYPDDNNLDYSEIDTSALTKDTGWKPSANFEKSIKETALFVKNCGLTFY
jgi:nucleoside-diphosphate-sugar epimerase